MNNSKTERLPNFNYEEFKKIVAGSHAMPNVENWDFSPMGDVKIRTDQGTVAGRRYHIGYEINLRKDMGYDQNTIDTIYGGQETMEDGLSIILYRNPINPREFLTRDG